MEKLDVVIIGATGFSGEKIVKMLAKLNCGLKWGIAGRSADKLKRLTAAVEELVAGRSKLPCQFICNIDDKSSLMEVCKQTKLIVNCIGPYTKTGHAVVEACIECGTHYIDITVELNFILDLSRKYHRRAEEANVLIVPACGLVAVISNMGFVYLEEQFAGTLKSVELYIDIQLPKEVLYPSSKNTLLHSGSLDSALERIVNMDKCQNLARGMLTDNKEASEMKKPLFRYRDGKVWGPNIFPDDDIAKLSQKYLNEVEGKSYIPFKVYNSCNFSFFFLIIIPFAFIYYFLLKFEWFRRLFRQHPKFFTCGYVSHEGPFEEVGKKVKCSMIYEGKGWSKDVEDFGLPTNKSIKLKVTAYDGYQATANAVVASTLTLLKESSRMPKGGVVNCAAAFRRTSIVDRLQEFGIKYEFIEKYR